MSPPRRILVLFAHPALQKSRLNSRMIAALSGLANITVHDLYEEYPDFLIDVRQEQQLLLTHDVIVFQHPFYWYSSPAILKEWLDLVLEYGFAYGPGGHHLQGKTLVCALTTGGGAAAYSREGHNYFTMRELLAPQEQTARLCGMRWLPPFVVHGSIQITDSEEMNRHAQDYARILTALRDDRLPYESVQHLPQLTVDLLPAKIRR